MNDILPPAPKRTGGAPPWAWALIGCGGLGCLGVLGLFAMGVYMFSQPEVQKMIRNIQEIPQDALQARQDFEQLHQGLEKYAKAKKAYPKQLADLAPDYVDASAVKAPEQAVGKSYVYTRPDAKAAGNTVVVQVTLPAPAPLPGAAPWIMKLHKDGEIEGMEWHSEANGQSMTFSAQVGGPITETK